MDNLSSGRQAEVSITFRVSGKAYSELLAECGQCGCTISHVVRHAVMKELAHRRAQRKRDADNDVLAGQMTLAERLGDA